MPAGNDHDYRPIPRDASEVIGGCDSWQRAAFQRCWGRSLARSAVRRRALRGQRLTCSSRTASSYSPVQQPMIAECGVERDVSRCRAALRTSAGASTCRSTGPCSPCGRRPSRPVSRTHSVRAGRSCATPSCRVSERKYSSVSALLANSFTDSTMTPVPYRNGTNTRRLSTSASPAGWSERRWRWRGALVGSPSCKSSAPISTASHPRAGRCARSRRLIRTARWWWSRSSTTTSAAGGDDGDSDEQHAHTPHHRELEHPFIMPAYRHRPTRGSSVPGRAAACRCTEYRSR